jgi:hypothetical protein
MQSATRTMQTKMIIGSCNFATTDNDLLCVTVSCNGKSFRFIRSGRTDICRAIEKLIDRSQPMYITVYPHEELQRHEVEAHNKVGNVYDLIYI